MPVALSVAFTCAFGTELPDGSVTVPLMAPRNVWAFVAKLNVRTTSTARNNLRITSTPLVEIFCTSDHSPLQVERSPPKCMHPAPAAHRTLALDNEEENAASDQNGFMCKDATAN